MLCLQEIKATRDHIPKPICDLPDYWCYWHGTKGYSGVALFVRKAIGGRAADLRSPRLRRRDAHRRPCASTASWSRRSTSPTAARTSPRRCASSRRWPPTPPPCARPATGSCCAATSTSRARRGTCIRGSATTGSSASGPRSGRCSSASWTRAGCTTSAASRIPTTTPSSPGGRPGGTCASATSAGGSTTCSPARRWPRGRRAACRMREFGTSDHAPVVATFADRRRVMIIVSDFDGTLTLDDVTTYIWDKYLPYDWRAKLLPPTYEGRLDAAPDDRARLRATSAFRPRSCSRRSATPFGCGPAWRRSPTFCRGRRLALRGRQPRARLLHRGAPAGVDPVHVVRRHVQRMELARDAAGDDGALPPGEDFKSHVVADLRARHPGPTGRLPRRRPARSRRRADLRSHLRRARAAASPISRASRVAPSRSSNRSTRSRPPCSRRDPVLRCAAWQTPPRRSRPRWATSRSSFSPTRCRSPQETSSSSPRAASTTACTFTA